MSSKIFLEENINLTNFDQFGLGTKLVALSTVNFIRQVKHPITINCLTTYNAISGGDWPSAPNPNLQLLEWALSGLLVATFVAVGLVINTICILFT